VRRRRRELDQSTGYSTPSRNVRGMSVEVAGPVQATAVTQYICRA
jgi:hypothetical protein